MQLNTIFLMAGWAVQAIQLIAALSILIILHEFGHFFFARLFKTRVEKFYLFFDFLFPFPGLLNFSLFKKKKGETEYGIGWFPMGGYVKIAGMVDESMDKDQMNKPPEPWEYRSKKAWQRLFIMLGGIIVNIITAMVIYSVVFGVWGEQYLVPEKATYGIAVDSLGESIGLKNGDILIGTDGERADRYSRIRYDMIIGQAKSLLVLRDGQEVSVDIPEGTVRQIIKGEAAMATFRVPFIVDSVFDNSEGKRMGLQKGDSVIALNGQPIYFFDEFKSRAKNLANQPIKVDVVRNGKAMSFAGNMPDSSRVGVAADLDVTKYYSFEKVRYGPIEAIGKGFSYTYKKFGEYMDQFKFIFTSKEVKASESLGGFASFGKGFDKSFDWKKFLMFTAFISIILAFMNLLPIPGLDGGYVFFLLIEMITGRQVSDKVLGIANTIGLVILLALMLYANGLDVFRALK